MNYDLKSHKFILTEDDVRDELGVELTVFLGDDKQVPIFLREASEDLYVWYYSRMLQENVPLVEYVLATDPARKEAIFAALIAQVRRMIRSGSHLMKDKVANINLRGMTEFKFDDLISEIAKQEMYRLQLHSMKPIPIVIPSNQIRGVHY